MIKVYSINARAQCDKDKQAGCGSEERQGSGFHPGGQFGHCEGLRN